MKKRVLFFATLMSLLAISTFGAGGVGVGNGKTTYRSPQGFSVAYPDELSLEVASESSFRISNAKVVSASERVSSIRFTVTRDRAHDLDGVAALARAEHPELPFAPTRLPGARGVFSETKSADSISGVYYLLTTNLDLVEVDLEAFTAGNGLKWVAPIVDSFVYDATAPAIHEIVVASHTWAAGSRQQIRVRATDDFSGLATQGSLYVSLRLLGLDGEFTTPYVIVSHELPYRVDGDWITIDFPVGDFVMPGDYVLDSIETRDLAGNSKFTRLDAAKDSYYDQTDHPEIHVPVVHLTLTNSGPSDLTPPAVTDLRTDTSTWRAGSTHRIFFRATDRVSGIDPKGFNCIGGLDSAQVGPSGYQSRAGDCGEARAEGDSWYSVEFKVSPYAPSGDYVLTEFVVNDRAGNRVFYRTGSPPWGEIGKFYDVEEEPGTLPVLHVQIVNDGAADVTPPLLLEVKVDSTTWRTGSTQRLRFRATDAQSGIETGYHGMGGYFVPVKKDSSGNQTLYLDHDIVADGDDWYHIDIPVSQFAKGGEYFLYTFYVSDRSGNGVAVDCAYEGVPYEMCKNTGGPEFPAIHVSVVR